MLHQNHKLQTRLQLIKRLLNTSNCESLIKCVIAFTDSQQSSISYNSKLSFYLNALINNNSTSTHKNENLSPATVTAITNNDKEILSHLNQILCNSGLNYKNELNIILNRANASNITESVLSETGHPSESTYLIINLNNSNLSRKNAFDLMNQLDKEFDDEILKIYNKSRTTFTYFLDQFDELTKELNKLSMNLTNQVVLMHSSVRKQYFQRLKLKFIKSYDIRHKCIYLIENMTHEKCIWHDSNSWPLFDILDQTEGPNRERRRLKKSHLYIPDRFFKQEFKLKLQNEKQPIPLRYLLSNYEDYLSSNNSSKSDSDGTLAVNYMLSNWKNSEIIRFNFYSFKKKDLKP